MADLFPMPQRGEATNEPRIEVDKIDGLEVTVRVESPERLYRAYGKDHVHLPPPSGIGAERALLAVESMDCGPHLLEISCDEGATWEKYPDA